MNWKAFVTSLCIGAIGVVLGAAIFRTPLLDRGGIAATITAIAIATLCGLWSPNEQ